jgi:hypothetical protein
MKANVVPLAATTLAKVVINLTKKEIGCHTLSWYLLGVKVCHMVFVTGSICTKAREASSSITYKQA